MSEQTTSGQVEPVLTNGGRQCSGCHRRGAALTLFENGKLYCSNCADSVTRLGIEPVVLDDNQTAIAEAGEPPDQSNEFDRPDDLHEDDDTAIEEERVMVNEPVQPEEIAVMPSLQPSTTPPDTSSSSEVSLHGVLQAERARLLEQRSALERHFRTDVEAIDARLLHVESLLGDQPQSLAG